MALEGETLATGAPWICPECGVHVKLQVCHSAAGYYVGSMCNCGPYSRESGYYRDKKDAEHALETGDYER